MAQTLIVMLKEPRPGRVKTRLGRDIGMVPAAWWFRHQVSRLLRRITDPRWGVVLAVSPDKEGLESRVWPSCFRRVPQGRGDLGDRMARVIRNAPPGPVIVIGADIPGIDRGQIARAFRKLGPADAVIGPAPDGGYWLIGVRSGGRLPHRAFHGVRWSGPNAREDTLRSLSGLRIAEVSELSDVDTAKDLRRR